MNHEQWTDMQAATNGHTPGPWGVHWRDWTENDNRLDGIGPIGHDNPCHDDDSWVHAIPANAYLAAAAPDLLAEVERLRGWLAYMRQNTPWDIMTRDRSFDALDGAEVPE